MTSKFCGSFLAPSCSVWHYQGPFDDLPAELTGAEHVVIPWADVSELEGTGLVHIAPGCGKEDFALGKEFGLKVVAPLDGAGRYLDGFGSGSRGATSTTSPTTSSTIYVTGACCCIAPSPTPTAIPPAGDAERSSCSGSSTNGSSPWDRSASR